MSSFELQESISLPCFYSSLPSTPAHHVSPAILKALHILSSARKTRDQVVIMCLPYLIRQPASKPSLSPRCQRTRFRAERERNLLLQGKRKPGIQTFPLTFTVISQISDSVLIINLIIHVVSTSAMSSSMQVLEL